MPKKSELNKFYDKIFVISIYDNTNRWNKVNKQFKRRGVEVERFVAVDGRCKDQGNEGCLDKLRTFEMAYNVTIPQPKGMKLQELVPASSLTIGTILILRQMVKKKWKRVLICEDDIELGRNIENRFRVGVKELGKTRWDLLYLGCGQKCGNKGLSWNKTKKNKRSFLSDYVGEDYYIDNPNDLRTMCEDDCTPFSEHLSWAQKPGGTWCYSISLSGARKLLKLFGNNAGHHIDQLLFKYTEAGKLRSLAFDPPIVMHEDISQGRNTDIPWEL